MWNERVGGVFKIKTKGGERGKKKKKKGDEMGGKRGDEKFIVCTAPSRDSFIKNIFPYSLSRSLTP